MFQHYWVVFKLMLTALATGVLLLKLAPITTLATAAAGAAFVPTDLSALRLSLLLHAIGGLAILLMISALAFVKPRGLTPYGARKLSVMRPSTGHRVPAWVKAFWIAGGLLLAVMLVMLAHGGHGPQMHGLTIAEPLNTA